MGVKMGEIVMARNLTLMFATGSEITFWEVGNLGKLVYINNIIEQRERPSFTNIFV